MIIFIEGIDRVGKDTQIAQIKKALYPSMLFQVLHFSKVPFDTSEENIEYSKKIYMDAFDLAIDRSVNKNLGTIFNRSHLGEMVYAPLFRNYPGDYVLDIESKRGLSNFDAHLITMVADPQVILAREDGNSLHEGKLDTLKMEIDLFEKAHSLSAIPNKLFLDCTNKSIEQVSGNILNFLNLSVNASNKS